MVKQDTVWQNAVVVCLRLDVGDVNIMYIQLWGSFLLNVSAFCRTPFTAIHSASNASPPCKPFPSAIATATMRRSIDKLPEPWQTYCAFESFVFTLEMLVAVLDIESAGASSCTFCFLGTRANQ